MGTGRQSGWIAPLGISTRRKRKMRKKSFNTTALLVTLALTAPVFAPSARAEDFFFDSHTSINGLTPAYSDPGSRDLARFSHRDSNLTLDWTNEGKEGGISRGSGVSAIYNTPEITAKNITVLATQKGNQLNDNGIIYSGTGHDGKITATETITIRANDDAIYTESNDHRVEISGFRRLELVSTGKPSLFSGSAGYAIMNNGTNNFLTITGGENSEIEMTNTGGRAVVADNSDTAGSTKTTLTADTIYLHAKGYYAIVQTKAHYAFTGGQIEINGREKTILTNENASGTAVSAQATAGGKGLIAINKQSQGVLEITGKVAATNGTADLDFAGDHSFLQGDMTASGGTGKILAGFNGAGARMQGDISAARGSLVTAAFSGEDASFTGNLRVAGTSRVDVSVTHHGLWTGKAETKDDAMTAVTLSNGSRWNVTENSNVSSLDLSSGATASLAGSAHRLDVGTLDAGGAPGRFELDLAYHDNNVATYENAADSDFLYAHGGSGSTFTVQPTAIASVDAMTAGDKLYFAQVKDGAAAFTVDQIVLFQNKNSLFDNSLSVQKEADAAQRGYEDWFLTPVGDGKTPNPNAFTPGSAHHAAVAAWRASDTLLQRLGELRYNREGQGLWARFVNKKLAGDGKDPFRTNLRTIQVGYDQKDAGDKRDWYYGGAVEHTWGSSDYAGYGNGKQHLTDVAFYATEMGNKGHYLDLVTKIGRLGSDYQTTYGDRGDFDNWAFSTGAEYGRKKDMGSGWFVEPQAQLTYYFLRGEDYTTQHGAIIHQDNTDNLVGRLGVVLSKEYAGDTKNPNRVYGKVSVLHDFLGNRSQTLSQNGVSYEDTHNFHDTWYTVGIGANLHFGGRYSFYADAEKNFGADEKEKYRVEGGVRFTF